MSPCKPDPIHVQIRTLLGDDVVPVWLLHMEERRRKLEGRGRYKESGHGQKKKKIKNENMGKTFSHT